MNAKSGEIVVGLLIGLAVGVASLFVAAGNHAQTVANETGQATSIMEYPREYPGRSVAWIATPTLSGAGLGWLVEQVNKSGDGSRTYQITAGGDVIIVDNGSSVSNSKPQGTPPVGGL